MANGDGGLGAAGAGADAGMGSNPVGVADAGCAGPPAPAPAPAPPIVPPAPVVVRPQVGPVIEVARNEVLVRKPYIPANTAKRTRVRLTDTNRAIFDGTGTLTATSAGGAQVDFFDSENGGAIVLSVGGSANFDAAALNARVTLWAEGVAPSATVNDVVLELTLSPGPTCDVLPPVRATLTSVELFLDIHQSRTTAAADPAVIPAPDKVNEGRFVHEQSNRAHGRALVIIRRAVPNDWPGNVRLHGFDNRVRLFPAANEVPAAGEPGPEGLPITLANGAIPVDGRRFWAEGINRSGGLRDTGFRLGIAGFSRDGDWVRMTVVRFTNLRATIQPTPPLTVRGNVPANESFQVPAARRFTEDFAANRPLVLIEGSVVAGKEVEAAVDIAPAGVPFQWSIERARQAASANLQDDAAIVALSANAVPAFQPVGAPSATATFSADNVGSFRIRAFVDCNANNTFEGDDPATGARIDREPFVVMNLVLARVTFFDDASRTRSANFVGVSDGANGIRARSGAFNIAAPNTAAIHMNARIDVVGGGADGTLGLNRVFAGWVNNENAAEDIVGSYNDTSVVPNQVRRHVSVFARNFGVATGAHPGGAPAFLPGDAAPILRSPPLLDSGQVNPGIGGSNACLTRSRIRNRVALAPAPGQRFRVEAVDSPGDNDPANHLGFAAAQLTNFRFRLFFRAALCVWTGTDPASGTPANRLYSVVREYEWRMRGAWTINPATGAVAVAGTAPSVRISGAVTHAPTAPVEGGDVEVRFPTGLAVLARDCRA